MKDEYDVIVIGAGPAGSTAARFAAEKVDVLVVDKHTEIGSPKRCGEGLGITAFEEFDIPLDKRFINRGIYGAIVHAPNGRGVEVRYKDVSGYTIERKIFDKFLAAEASRRGAKILADADASLLMEDGKVSGVRIEHQGGETDVKAKVIIAADGVDSQIAKQAGINTTIDPHDMDSCFEYEMTGIEIEMPDMIHVFMGNDLAPRGYAWIFPKDDDRANVGIGISGKEKGTAKQYLDKFVGNVPGLRDGGILEVNVGCVPVGGFLKELVRDNLMVVGDAARQVNPIHGGGIREVMRAGKLAGIKAGNAIESGNLNILKEYETEWFSNEGKKLDRILKIRYFMEGLVDEDMNYLAGIWNGDDVVRICRGEHVVALKKIIKNPKLLGLLKNFV
jgi:digeranylgeranylglycerophospholipid reductase